ncbi:MAG: hypothetical protein ABI843_11690 [Dokdonella sp.]
MAIEWTTAEGIVDQLGKVFVQAMLGNMPGNSVVRLGETGEGTAPNYQVENDSSVMTYSGRSHREWAGDSQAFNDERLSSPFPREDIFRVFLSRFRSPKGSARS